MDRDAQRYSGKIVAETLQYVKSLIMQGELNTLILNNLAEDFMLSKNVNPACKGYQPFFNPAPYKHGTCLSVNHEIVHGPPSADKILKEGDLVSIDIVGEYQGWYADAAITVPVGNISGNARRLLKRTEEALYKAIAEVKADATVGDISSVIQAHARKHGLGIAKYLSGHGIGQAIHCPPSIPNIGKKDVGPILEIGMSICIEPMFTLGTDDNHIGDDTWAVVTDDKSLAAHFEHTILINEDGMPEILTSVMV